MNIAVMLANKFLKNGLHPALRAMSPLNVLYAAEKPDVLSPTLLLCLKVVVGTFLSMEKIVRLRIPLKRTSHPVLPDVPIPHPLLHLDRFFGGLYWLPFLCIAIFNHNLM